MKNFDIIVAKFQYHVKRFFDIEIFDVASVITRR